MIWILLLAAGLGEAAPGPEPAEVFRQACGRLARTARTITARGRDGFLLLDAELRHLSTGRFWGDRARRTGQASDPRRRDPLPAIVDYARRVRESGRSLVFVPVPSKALIHPEAVWPEAPRAPDGVPLRLDPHQQEFVRLLAEAGVEVLDPTDLFLRARAREKGPLYCRQDSHYALPALRLLAEALAARVRKEPWAAGWPRAELRSETRRLEIEGDLWKMLKLETARPPPREVVELRLVGHQGPGEFSPVPLDPSSPVLLLGDSHVLVFHAGADMHAVGAGLPEQLGLELGFAVDAVAVRGSGGTNERLEVARRARQDPAWLARKRILLWVVAARELSRSRTGWSVEVPLSP
jgi:alginate O-acetyltransferase complex protein AlgJ